MTIFEQMNHFSDRFGKRAIVNNTTWRYYRVGAGAPILWLTGGLRRAALGFTFMERLAKCHLVIAPDYPPVQTIDEFITAFDTILQTEGIDTFALGGQSYGGLLAQAYLAHRPRLSNGSSSPAPVRQITAKAGCLWSMSQWHWRTSYPKRQSKTC